MPEIGTPKFDRGAERLNFPNDREPTDEELEQTGVSTQWLREKGPWFAACYHVYRSIKVNDSVQPNNISHQLGGTFPELQGNEGWEYGHRAEAWYRQKTQTSPEFKSAPPPEPKIGPPTFDKKEE